MAINLFGFEISKKVSPQNSVEAASPIPKPTDESSATVAVGGGYYGQYVDLSNTDTVSDHELIRKYREAAMQPECDAAVSDIVDGAIASSDESSPVDLSMGDLDLPSNVKKKIINEFNRVLKLYKFNRNASEYFRNWYVDGKAYFNVIIDPNNPQKGIIELRPVESTHINKVKEVKQETDKKTGLEYEKVVDEYYVYSPDLGNNGADKLNGIKFANDAIIQVNSGIMDPDKIRTVGHLHKAMKLVNQLRYMEDSLVVYRVSRAPERRIFYIDVGNLPKGKA